MLVKRADEVRIGDYILVVPLGGCVLEARKVSNIFDGKYVFVTVEKPGRDQDFVIYSFNPAALIPVLGNTGGLTPWPA